MLPIILCFRFFKYKYLLYKKNKLLQIIGTDWAIYSCYLSFSPATLVIKNSVSPENDQLNLKLYFLTFLCRNFSIDMVGYSLVD